MGWWDQSKASFLLPGLAGGRGLKCLEMKIQIQSNVHFQIEMQGDKVFFWTFACPEGKSAFVLKPNPAA